MTVIGKGKCIRCEVERVFDNHAIARIDDYTIVRCTSCGYYDRTAVVDGWKWDGAITDVQLETPGASDPIEVRLVARDTLTLDLMQDIQQIADRLGAHGDEVITVTTKGNAYLDISLEHLRQAYEIERLKSPKAA